MIGAASDGGVRSGLIQCFGKKTFTGFCYDLCFQECISIVITGLALSQLLKRRSLFGENYKKKNMLYYLILISSVCFLVYNLDQQILIVAYFFQLYFQYLFLIYVVYYFARKTVKLNSVKRHQMNQLTIYCYLLVLFFTIFLFYNLVDYIITVPAYKLCQKQIFHIMRIIGFLIDLLLLIIAHILHFLIKKSLNSSSANFNEKYQGHTEKVLKRRSDFWKLVFCTFFSQTLYFTMDVYFLIDPAQCSNLYNDATNNKIQVWAYIVLFIFGFFAVQAPFILTLVIFWFHPQQPSEKPSISVEIEADTFGFQIFSNLLEKNRLSPIEKNRLSPTFTATSKS